MLLSRVADALYWLSRYLERAEHTARVIDVRLDLGLDRNAEGWDFDRLYAGLRIATPDEAQAGITVEPHRHRFCNTKAKPRTTTLCGVSIWLDLLYGGCRNENNSPQAFPHPAYVHGKTNSHAFSSRLRHGDVFSRPPTYFCRK